MRETLNKSAANRMRPLTVGRFTTSVHVSLRQRTQFVVEPHVQDRFGVFFIHLPAINFGLGLLGTNELVKSSGNDVAVSSCDFWHVSHIDLHPLGIVSRGDTKFARLFALDAGAASSTL